MLKAKSRYFTHFIPPCTLLMMPPDLSESPIYYAVPSYFAASSRWTSTHTMKTCAVTPSRHETCAQVLLHAVCTRPWAEVPKVGFRDDLGFLRETPRDLAARGERGFVSLCSPSGFNAGVLGTVWPALSQITSLEAEHGLLAFFVMLKYRIT